MSERPHSRYTREKTWAALYIQHINASYAWVPYSITNNSIDLIRCDSPESARQLMQELPRQADACATYYARSYQVREAMAVLGNNPNTSNADLAATLHLTLEAAEPFIKEAREVLRGVLQDALCPAVLLDAARSGKIRTGAVLARSHDYYHYSLYDHPHIRLVICGLHDSYLPVPVWEMRTNKRYKSRETAVSCASPDFDRVRRTQTGHHILLAAYAHGDPDAVAFVERKDFPERTRRRLKREKEALQEAHYRGRPMAFLTEAERQAIGGKISEGLKRYHAQKRGEVI